MATTETQIEKLTYSLLAYGRITNFAAALDEAAALECSYKRTLKFTYKDKIFHLYSVIVHVQILSEFSLQNIKRYF